MRLSALPPENRFVPQHDPRARPASSRQPGALQFVPAYEESTSPVITTKASPMQEEAPAPTWMPLLKRIVEYEGDHCRGEENQKRRVPSRIQQIDPFLL
jgi:hypothetical protein